MRMKSLYLGCNTTFTLKLGRIAIKGSFFASLHALTSVGLRNDTIKMTTDDVNKMRRERNPPEVVIAWIESDRYGVAKGTSMGQCSSSFFLPPLALVQEFLSGRLFPSYGFLKAMFGNACFSLASFVLITKSRHQLQSLP